MENEWPNVADNDDVDDDDLVFRGVLSSSSEQNEKMGKKAISSSSSREQTKWHCHSGVGMCNLSVLLFALCTNVHSNDQSSSHWRRTNKRKKATRDSCARSKIKIAFDLPKCVFTMCDGECVPRQAFSRRIAKEKEKVDRKKAMTITTRTTTKRNGLGWKWQRDKQQQQHQQKTTPTADICEKCDLAFGKFEYIIPV